MTSSRPGQITGIGTADIAALSRALIESGVQHLFNGSPSGALPPLPGYTPTGPDPARPSQPVIAAINIRGGP